MCPAIWVTSPSWRHKHLLLQLELCVPPPHPPDCNTQAVFSIALLKSSCLSQRPGEAWRELKCQPREALRLGRCRGRGCAMGQDDAGSSGVSGRAAVASAWAVFARPLGSGGRIGTLCSLDSPPSMVRVVHGSVHANCSHAYVCSHGVGTCPLVTHGVVCAVGQRTSSSIPPGSQWGFSVCT